MVVGDGVGSVVGEVVGGETGVAIPQLIVNLREQLLKLTGVVGEYLAGVLLC